MSDRETIDLQIRIEEIDNKITRIDARRSRSMDKMIELQGALAEISPSDEVGIAKLKVRAAKVNRIEAYRDVVAARLVLKKAELEQKLRKHLEGTALMTLAYNFPGGLSEEQAKEAVWRAVWAAYYDKDYRLEYDQVNNIIKVYRYRPISRRH